MQIQVSNIQYIFTLESQSLKYETYAIIIPMLLCARSKIYVENEEQTEAKEPYFKIENLLKLW